MGRLIIRRKVLIPGINDSCYEVSNSGSAQNVTIFGKKQANSSPPRINKNPPYCTDYVIHSRKIVVGRFSIRGLLSPNGKMSGSESWKTSGWSYIRDKIGFGIDYLRAPFPDGEVKFSPSKLQGDCHNRIAKIKV